MLGGVIVDDPATPELDLGKTLTLMNGATVPSASDLALRLVRAFFNITSPGNYQVHSAAHPTTWDPTYPAVPVRAYDKDGNPVVIPNLDAFFDSYFHEPVTLPKVTAPSVKGVGEVWIDTEYEKTAHKTKPGTATAVDAASWKVTKKFALPELDFNNPHNLWTDRDQKLIYNTEWFGNRLAAFDRLTGKVVASPEVGEAPAHVMTRVDTDQVHTTLNGEGAVVELEPGRQEHQPQDPGAGPRREARAAARPLDGTGRPHDVDAELQHQRLDAAQHPGGLDHLEGPHRDAADRQRHDARREQVLRVQLRRQHDQRRRHVRAAARDQDDQPAPELRPDHAARSPDRSAPSRSRPRWCRPASTWCRRTR